MQFVGNIEALQQDGSVALGSVAVFFAYCSFKLTQPHTIFVGHFRLGIDSVALFQCRPETLIAHDHGVNHAIGIEGKLVLAQHPELFGADDRTFLRVLFTCQELHKRRLAGAVGAGEAVALSRHEAGGNFVKQNFGAEAHGHIAN